MSKVARKYQWAAGELLDWEKALRHEPDAAVPGTVLERIFVPARGYMRARELRAGQVFRIVNICGHQVMDVMLYDLHNLKNCASMSNTTLTNATLRLTSGHSIFAKNGMKMASVIDDTAGYCAADGGYCTDALNELRYGVQGSPNCRANLVASMAAYGVTFDDLQEGCFTPFLCLQYGTDGSITLVESPAKAGDHFDIRAEADIIVSASACPSERAATNNYNPSPMGVIIYQ